MYVTADRDLLIAARLPADERFVFYVHSLSMLSLSMQVIPAVYARYGPSLSLDLAILLDVDVFVGL